MPNSSSPGSGEREWRQRAALCGTTLRGVLFRNLPDGFNEHIHRLHARTILAAIESRKGLRILDVGCGYGRLSSVIIARHPDVDIMGVDISAPFVTAYQEHTGHDAVQADVERLDLEIGTFDFVICVTVLMYVDREHLAAAVNALLGRLKPNGRLIVIENNRSGVALSTLWGLATLFRGKPREHASSTSGRVFEDGELRRFFADRGGAVLSESRFPATTVLFPFLIAAALLLPERWMRRLSRATSYLDRSFGYRCMPSIYTAQVVSVPGGATRRNEHGIRCE